MYTTRIIDSKEKERFDTFVAHHPKGHFLQTWEWGEVKRGMGWQPLPLVLEEDGEIKAALLILKRKLPLPLVDRCIFYAPRGPVADIENPEICRALFAGAERAARDHRAIFLKIDPDVTIANENFAYILSQSGFHQNKTGLDFEGVQPAFVFQLDIRPSAEQLLANMHTKTRYNIKLAQRKGVTIRPAVDKADLGLFYDILQETAERDAFMVRGYEYFEMIWDHMVSSGIAQVFLAEYEGQAVSAALALILGKKAWYLYGASSNQYRNVMPNYLIQWEMINWAKANGCEMYDFRGVSGDLSEDNPLYGLYRFKKGFNGELVEFIGDWDRVYSKVYYFMWSRVLPIYMKDIRRLIRKLRPSKAGEISDHGQMD